jgi:hypothetical protein
MAVVKYVNALRADSLVIRPASQQTALSLRISVLALSVAAANTKRIRQLEVLAALSFRIVHAKFATLALHSASMQHQLQVLRTSHASLAKAVFDVAVQLREHGSVLRSHSRQIADAVLRHSQFDTVADVVAVVAAVVISLALAPLARVVLKMLTAMFNNLGVVAADGAAGAAAASSSTHSLGFRVRVAVHVLTLVTQGLLFIQTLDFLRERAVAAGLRAAFRSPDGPPLPGPVPQSGSWAWQSLLRWRALRESWMLFFGSLSSSTTQQPQPRHPS